jgi:hypothetical protein
MGVFAAARHPLHTIRLIKKRQAANRGAKILSIRTSGEERFWCTGM